MSHSETNTVAAESTAAVEMKAGSVAADVTAAADINAGAAPKKEGMLASLKKYFGGSDKVNTRNRSNLIAIILAGVSYMFFQNVIGNYMSFFYTEFMLVPAAGVSLILSVGVIIDAVSDFAMGAIVDRVETKYGKAKHWFLWMTIPTAIATMAVWMCQPDWSTTAKLIYLFIVYNIYCTALTTMNMPRYALLSLGYNNPDARQQASVVSGFIVQIGTSILSSIVGPLLAVLGNGIAAYRGLSLVGCALGTIAGFAAFHFVVEVVGSKAAVRNLRETEGDEAADRMIRVQQTEVKGGGKKEKADKRTVLRDLGYLLRNKYWLIKQISVIANSISIGFMIGTATYFAKYILGNIAAVGGVYGVMSIGMLVGMLLCSPIVVRFDSRVVGILGSFIACGGMCLAAFAAMSLNNLPLMYAGIFIRQIGTGFILAVENDLTARTVDYGEWKFGVRLDGLAYSGNSVMQKIMQAVATAILGVILTASGYAGGLDVLPASATRAIQNLFLTVPAIALVVCGLSYIMFDLSNDKVKKMQAEILERSAQKTQQQ